MADMSSLADKVAVVTGASKGMGSGIAKAFAAAGARVAVNSGGAYSLCNTALICGSKASQKRLWESLST